MKTTLHKHASRAAYTLIEVTVASSILMIGVGAACVLSLTMLQQEGSHLRVNRATNIIENAAHLYQLGIAPADIAGILPPDPMVKAFSYRAPTTAETVDMPQIGNPQVVMLSLEYYTSEGAVAWTPGTWGTRPDTADASQKDTRTIGPLKVYRHSYRP
ncbi:MAG: type II secretory pathway pseudopilin PulG [Verrucomicrobiales bacterium]|jgi:type II secretory pathway pseudopilin PulG